MKLEDLCQVCWAIAAAIFLLSVSIAILLAVFRGTHSKKRVFTPFRILMAGVFFTAAVLVFPYHYAIDPSISATSRPPFYAILSSLYHALRVFILEGDLSELIQHHDALYSFSLTLIFFLAPATTVGTILSFFKETSAYGTLFFHPFAPAYVFSELNEKSLTLATDIKKNQKNALLIFCDVFEQNDETSFEMLDRAEKIGAFCFKKDLLALSPRLARRYGAIYFFAIAEEGPEGAKGDHTVKALSAISGEQENLKQAYALATDRHFKNRKDTHLYVFSKTTLGELLLSRLPEEEEKEEKKKEESEVPTESEPEQGSAPEAAQGNGESAPRLKAQTLAEHTDKRIKIRRINDIRSVIYHSLSKDSVLDSLFKSAWEDENGIKHIHAVIVGLGGHGGVMLRTLVWFCQVDGYALSIDVFDKEFAKVDAFRARFTDLLQKNGSSDPNDARYKITFHSGLLVQSPAFFDTMGALSHPTFVLVCLGSDVQNVETAVALRRHFLQLPDKNHPEIYAIVYDSDNNRVLPTAAACNKGPKYEIKCIGSLKETYSQNAIINDELEDIALRIHLEAKNPESTFYRYEYNYRSSMASALYRNLCLYLKLIEDGKDAKDYTAQQKAHILKYEHIRWNAYMRSEGFSYNETRDHIALKHPDLLPCDQLSTNQQRKIKFCYKVDVCSEKGLLKSFREKIGSFFYKSRRFKKAEKKEEAENQKTE